MTTIGLRYETWYLKPTLLKKCLDDLCTLCIFIFIIVHKNNNIAVILDTWAQRQSTKYIQFTGIS